MNLTFLHVQENGYTHRVHICNVFALYGGYTVVWEKFGIKNFSSKARYDEN